MLAQQEVYAMTLQNFTYNDAELMGREAFQRCLTHDIYHAQELLLHAHNMLKHLSGDLPIVGYDTTDNESMDTPFVTRSFEEAQAWGWLEIAQGTFKLFEDHPGTSIVYFKRAWRIWRTWEGKSNERQEQQWLTARAERTRAGLWLGEAWARFMSERAEPNARAVTRAALAELTRLGRQDLLQETIAQQRCLPPALVGSLAFRPDGQSVPFVTTLLDYRP